MTEHNKGNESSATEQNETDVVSMLKRMQQQLVYLEKKIDTLIAAGGQSQGQSQFRPPFRDRPFSKPFRSYGNSHTQFRPDHGNRPNSGPPRGNQNREGFKKKPFYGKRERSA